MEQKWIEIRDRGTFIPALAMRFTGDVHWLARRAGFGKSMPYVVLINMVRMAAQFDPYEWESGARTMRAAHHWLLEHWDEQADGGVLDVEFILGERTAPKVSERNTHDMVESR
jgi:hypothetical protein